MSGEALHARRRQEGGRRVADPSMASCCEPSAPLPPRAPANCHRGMTALPSPLIGIQSPFPPVDSTPRIRIHVHRGTPCLLHGACVKANHRKLPRKRLDIAPQLLKHRNRHPLSVYTSWRLLVLHGACVKAHHRELPRESLDVGPQLVQDGPRLGLEGRLEVRELLAHAR